MERGQLGEGGRGVRGGVGLNPADLYGLPLARFTEERHALAKQLRAEGQKAEAARVAKLRKPSAAAWAVNQLVRTQRREVDVLFQAGDELQQAQADVLGGRDAPGALRRAAAAERAAVDALSAKARGLLSPEGHELAPAKLEQVSETLHAAAIDPEAREAVRDGCLERELRHVGLGALGAGGTPASRRGRRDTRAAELKSARAAEAAAGRERKRAEQGLQAAQARRERAADQLGEAEQALTTARELAEEAIRVHERARRALEEL